MMRAVKKFGLILVLLQVTGLLAVVSGAGTLPKTFPLNVIPIPKDAIIEDWTQFAEDPHIHFIKRRTSCKQMIAFYQDSLKDTIYSLNQSWNKDKDMYFFWGEFDNGNTCFYLFIGDSDTGSPDDDTSGQIRVALRKKDEAFAVWRGRKNLVLDFAAQAVK